MPTNRADAAATRAVMMFSFMSEVEKRTGAYEAQRGRTMHTLWIKKSIQAAFITSINAQAKVILCFKLGAIRIKLTNMLSIFADSLGQAGIPF